MRLPTAVMTSTHARFGVIEHTSRHIRASMAGVAQAHVLQLMHVTKYTVHVLHLGVHLLCNIRTSELIEYRFHLGNDRWIHPSSHVGHSLHTSHVLHSSLYSSCSSAHATHGHIRHHSLHCDRVEVRHPATQT